MITEIKKPIKPIAKTPKAEIFATSLNSFELGFTRMCHTLIHCAKNSLIAIIGKEN